jgi:hypothetical protein
MLDVQPFRPYHIDLIRAQGVQGAQLQQVSHVPAQYATLAVVPGQAWTASLGETILLCGGIMPMGPKMGVLWAVLSEEAAKHLVRLHRGVERFLSIDPPRRLEATVEKGFESGCRWLHLLRFRYEGEMACYGLDGETHLRYARLF